MCQKTQTQKLTKKPKSGRNNNWQMMQNYKSGERDTTRNQTTKTASKQKAAKDKPNNEDGKETKT